MFADETRPQVFGRRVEYIAGGAVEVEIDDREDECAKASADEEQRRESAGRAQQERRESAGRTEREESVEWRKSEERRGWPSRLNFHIAYETGGAIEDAFQK